MSFYHFSKLLDSCAKEKYHHMESYLKKRKKKGKIKTIRTILPSYTTLEITQIYCHSFYS